MHEIFKTEVGLNDYEFQPSWVYLGLKTIKNAKKLLLGIQLQFEYVSLICKVNSFYFASDLHEKSPNADSLTSVYSL